MGSPHVTRGAIIEIDLENGYYAYGRILGKASYCIYDLYSAQRIADPHQLLSNPLLFIVAVISSAITSGRWRKIGKAPLLPALQKLPHQFIQDALHPERFELYDPNTGTITPAHKKECEGLERCSVWTPEQVEERIRDYYAGRTNHYRQAD